MKRVLFVLHVPPPVHGSAIMGQHIVNSNLIKTSFDAGFININTSRSIFEIGKTPFYKFVRFLAVLIRLITELFKRRPDLCYVAVTSKGPALYKDAVIVFFVKLFSVKIIYHFHNKGVSENQFCVFNRMLYRFLFVGTNAILLSKHLYYDVEKYFAEKQVYYCPNGIPLNRTSLKKARNRTGPIKILFLSNLIKSKGVFLLLESCKLLNQMSLDFLCVFVGGEGDIDRELFQKKVDDLGLCEKVKYMGAMFGPQKESVLSEADIFVHPTLNDCFPLVLLEAMQFCLPVVSTVEGGIPEIVEDKKNGFLVSCKDAKLVAEKLDLLIRDKRIREEMGLAGRKKFEGNFTLDVFERRLIEILNNVLNGK